MQGVLVILAGHDEIVEQQHELGQYSMFILASRAINALVARTLENRLLQHQKTVALSVIIVGSETPGIEQSDVPAVLTQGEILDPATSPVEELGPSGSHVQAGLVTDAAGHCAVVQTVDLDQELMQPAVPPTEDVRPVPIGKKDWAHAKNSEWTCNDLDEVELNRACLAADGACMACDEPFHVAMVPSNRSAFVHRNKPLMDRLLLVSMSPSPCT